MIKKVELVAMLRLFVFEYSLAIKSVISSENYHSKIVDLNF